MPMAEAQSINPEKLDTSNSIFQKAVDFVKYTDENLFLTGKAGTGKTTFLKYIRTQTSKQCAVVAPTGVAAINAGGETIHSFLQLPFGPFVPGSAGGFGRQAADTHDKHSLLANQHLRETKLKLLRKLELLIIDEISMVRADLLDSIDLVLRHVRKTWDKPFGGVQMIFIGDMFQLPPVAPEQDWDILRHYYASPYFFDAHVLLQNPPLYIELKKIYRQKDQVFIDILNRIRNGGVKQEDVATLNLQYDPTPKKEAGYIILCTHNRIADGINQQELQNIAKPMHTFKGTITNDFNPKNLPTDEVLQLKAGAQIMFVKNDVQTPRRYYNGKIATVSAINSAGVWASFPDEDRPDELLLELETWKNVRYIFDQATGKIEEQESGSFTQFPVRLAWAITVHKSQGLTLQKAIVDLNQAFAPGQVYVALSRCTNMEGLVLRSKLSISNIIVDERVVAFAESESEEDVLEEMLRNSRRQAVGSHLCRLFSFHELVAQTIQMHTELLKRKTGPVEQNMALHGKILKTLNQAEEHAQAFQKQIMLLIQREDDAQLEIRKAAASVYFCTKVIDVCTEWTNAHITYLGTIPKPAKHITMWKLLETHLKDKAAKIKANI
jgi:ATP-dependent exoDNAse (exonuclease V) alpha subunit